MSFSVAVYNNGLGPGLRGGRFDPKAGTPIVPMSKYEQGTLTCMNVISIISGQTYKILFWIQIDVLCEQWLLSGTKMHSIKFS